MPWGSPTLLIVMVLAVLALVLMTLYAFRFYRLTSATGCFECTYLGKDSKLVTGMARFREERLEFHRLGSLAFRPVMSWDRSLLEIQASRVCESKEPVIVQVACSYKGYAFSLLMHQGDHLGFVSWIEGAPPHTQIYF